MMAAPSSPSVDLAQFIDGRWLAELYEERGQTDKAYKLYAALVEQWRYADPELQPQVQKIRDRMKALERRKGD